MSNITLESLSAEVAQMKVDYNESLDTIWMLVTAALVFFMHAGFSLLEAGTVQFKNAQNILGKNLIVVTSGFLCWYVLGYPLAFGAVEDPGKFAGFTNFFMDGFWDDKTRFRNFFFQGIFCATSGTIVSGAMAERTQLKGFTIFIVLLTAIVYPIVVYWIWSGNGIFNYKNDAGESVAFTDGPPFMDFAGSGVVHLVGGTAALCGAVIVGPRKGRFDGAEELESHSIPFVVLGTFCLWFGWYGFNPGSTLSMHDKATAVTAGLAAVNTTIAPCIAGLVVFLLRRFVFPPKLLDVGGFCNGILAGLVAITAGCNVVKPWEAFIIGLIGGVLYQLSSALIVKLKVDDVVDAFSVHGVCGLWGVLSLGFFGNPDEGMNGNGVIYGGTQLGTQLLGSLFIIVWVALISIAAFVPMRFLKMLRLGDKFQDLGADVMEHSPAKAYATEAESPYTVKTV